MSVNGWADGYAPPPEKVRFRWLDLIERLRPDWRTVIDMDKAERLFRRNIIRWIMSPDGAVRSLPTGYVVHAWADRDPNRIVLVRTR